MTAVEYLVKKYFEDYNVLISELEFQQAIEIEKQQIIDAFNLGQQKEAKQEFWTKGEQYYNETFKNK